MPQSLLRLVTTLLLLVYTTLAVGIPLPLGEAATDPTPFPCQASGCDCRTAEQCWKSCCCHSRAERIAWALRNGVTPPAQYFSAKELAARSPVARAKPACCAAREARASQSKPRRIAWVMYVAAQKCRGTTADHWGDVPLSTVPATTVDCPHLGNTVEWLAQQSPLLPRTPPFSPPVPPPRSA